MLSMRTNSITATNPSKSHYRIRITALNRLRMDSNQTTFHNRDRIFREVHSTNRACSLNSLGITCPLSIPTTNPQHTPKIVHSSTITPALTHRPKRGLNPSPNKIRITKQSTGTTGTQAIHSAWRIHRDSQTSSISPSKTTPTTTLPIASII